MSTEHYVIADATIKSYNSEGATFPSGLQSGAFPITEFAPTGFPYLQTGNNNPLSNDSQITHFGINAGKVLPYVVSPALAQTIWSIEIPAGVITYLKLGTDLAPGFNFTTGVVEIVNNGGNLLVQLDCARSIAYTATGAINMRISGTDFYGRKQVDNVQESEKDSAAFTTISSIRLENTTVSTQTVTIGTTITIGLPYFDDLGYNFLGASYNGDPLLTSVYQENVFDNVDYIVDTNGFFLPRISPIIETYTQDAIMIVKQAVFGFGSIPTYFSPEKFNTDLYSNLDLIIGKTPPSENWIGWRG